MLHAQSMAALGIRTAGSSGRNPTVGNAFAVTLVVCTLAGCSPMPPRNADSGELEYRYRPPTAVNEGDRKECVTSAEGIAQSARVNLSATEENTANVMGVLFGAFGALANVGYAVGRVRAERETAYENAMRTCLAVKGYSVP